MAITLRVTVTYSDRRRDGATDTKTAQKVIENPVLGALADQYTHLRSVQPTANRSIVSENAPSGYGGRCPGNCHGPRYRDYGRKKVQKSDLLAGPHSAMTPPIMTCSPSMRMTWPDQGERPRRTTRIPFGVGDDDADEEPNSEPDLLRSCL